MSGQHEHTELSSLYSEACQAFVLRDFETTAGIVESLLDRIERDGLGLAPETSESALSLQELVRRVWILQVTLLASSDDELAGNAKQAERELSGILSRIERFYSRQDSAISAASATPSTSSSSAVTVLVHPSLLVAVSLAGLKLNIPSFVRRTLQDYFRLLLSHATGAEAALSSSRGDGNLLDASHADLSLSGIAVNGHDGPAVDPQHGSNGAKTYGPAANAANRVRSLHRLARIYSVHLLGKTLGEWSAARAWIREQMDDDDAVAAGLMDDTYAQTLLEVLEDTKHQQEEEEAEARQAEKQEKERQAELSKRNKQRNTVSSSPQGSKSSPTAASNGQALPSRPERSKDRMQSTSASERASGNTQECSSPTSSLPRRNMQEQETGFSAFRSHLSNFLSSDPHSAISRRDQSGIRDLSRNPATTSFEVFRLYLSRIVHSRFLRFLLAFFIITGFWRRRLARSGRKIEIGKSWTRLREKVMETIKMGGSLGFL